MEGPLQPVVGGQCPAQPDDRGAGQVRRRLLAELPEQAARLFEVLAEEIEEGRALYQSRVSAELVRKNFYPRAIVDILVRSKRHIKSKVW